MAESESAHPTAFPQPGRHLAGSDSGQQPFRYDDMLLALVLLAHSSIVLHAGGQQASDGGRPAEHYRDPARHDRVLPTLSKS
ncbi:hypothetical protein [Streptomyces sp. NBC_01363]|uniref:hypothetical protein n=1 Tax=Streptomyces sp. NBC_01363 TaxID=2903840 RepID=UPI002259A90C|nr:hypothetical protein [Streptomyces sp. NBC_01363]MCX4734373.1 hypothetical protein [Streptomyces sp. NBC_01363]